MHLQSREASQKHLACSPHRRDAGGGPCLPVEVQRPSACRSVNAPQNNRPGAENIAHASEAMTEMDFETTTLDVVSLFYPQGIGGKKAMARCTPWGTRKEGIRRMH